MRVDLHVELHHVENSRPADSAPYFTRLTRFGFNWRDPLRKISKAVTLRDTNQLFRRDTEGSWFWFRFRSFRRRAVWTRPVADSDRCRCFLLHSFGLLALFR